jgi:hypothetical protein
MIESVAQHKTDAAVNESGFQNAHPPFQTTRPNQPLSQLSHNDPVELRFDRQNEFTERWRELTSTRYEPVDSHVQRLGAQALRQAQGLLFARRTVSPSDRPLHLDCIVTSQELD